MIKNTLFIGNNCILVESCDSTNTFLSEMIANTNLPEGTVVATNRQLRGKGQRGSVWESEDFLNCTLSILLKPNFLHIGEQFFLNMTISNAVRNSIQYFLSTKVLVKWPNDILVEDKKICGMLIENQIVGSSINQSVIGIGINVNQNNFRFSNATSIKNEIHKEVDLEYFKKTLFENIEREYLVLRSLDFETIKNSYVKNLFKFQIDSKFIIDDKEVEGRIVGVATSGQLIVCIDNKLETFDFKQIKFIF